MTTTNALDADGYTLRCPACGDEAKVRIEHPDGSYLTGEQWHELHRLAGARLTCAACAEALS